MVNNDQCHIYQIPLQELHMELVTRINNIKDIIIFSLPLTCEVRRQRYFKAICINIIVIVANITTDYSIIINFTADQVRCCRSTTITSYPKLYISCNPWFSTYFFKKLITLFSCIKAIMLSGTTNCKVARPLDS